MFSVDVLVTRCGCRRSAGSGGHEYSFGHIRLFSSSDRRQFHIANGNISTTKKANKLVLEFVVVVRVFVAYKSTKRTPPPVFQNQFSRICSSQWGLWVGLVFGATLMQFCDSLVSFGSFCVSFSFVFFSFFPSFFACLLAVCFEFLLLLHQLS